MKYNAIYGWRIKGQQGIKELMIAPNFLLNLPYHS